MKTTSLRHIAFAIFAFAAMGAQAQPIQSEFADSTSFVSSKTRAEVRQELANARQDGSYTQVDGLYQPAAASSTPLSRAQVLDELTKAKVAAKAQMLDATTL